MSVGLQAKAPSTHLYVPVNQCRAANVGNVHTKLRITAILTVNVGEFAHVMLLHRMRRNFYQFLK